MSTAFLTCCHNIANNQPIVEKNPGTEQEFLVIDDLLGIIPSQRYASEHLHLAFLGSIRNSTERLEAMDKGVVIIGHIASDHVLQVVDLNVLMCENGDDAVPVLARTDKSVSSTKVIRLI